MLEEIPESDWNLVLALHDVALARFCQAALEEAQGIGLDGSLTAPERFRKLHGFLREKDKDLAGIFGDSLRRSRAVVFLHMLQSWGLLRPAELARFSPPTRARLGG